jgi:hypothetical protein
MEDGEMPTAHLPPQRRGEVFEERGRKALLEDELLDLYSALLIVIPLLLIVKSVWL